MVEDRSVDFFEPSKAEPRTFGRSGNNSEPLNNILQLLRDFCLKISFFEQSAALWSWLAFRIAFSRAFY
jgi:hypothetical protein